MVIAMLYTAAADSAVRYVDKTTGSDHYGGGYSTVQLVAIGDPNGAIGDVNGELGSLNGPLEYAPCMGGYAGNLTISPGDRIKLKRGGDWSNQVWNVCNSGVSGTASDPITLEAYGAETTGYPPMIGSTTVGAYTSIYGIYYAGHLNAYGSNVTARYCIFDSTGPNGDDTGEIIGALVTGDDCCFQNCLFYKHGTTGIFAEGTGLQVVNTIFESIGIADVIGDYTGSNNYSSNDGDPKFIKPESDDFRIKNSSPCASGGTPWMLGSASIVVDIRFRAVTNANGQLIRTSPGSPPRGPYHPYMSKQIIGDDIFPTYSP